MVIKNLTSKPQKIEVKEIAGDHNLYDIYLEPNGRTDLDSHLVLDINKYAGIIEIEGLAPLKEVVAPKVEEPAKVVEEVAPVEDSVPEEIVEEKEVEEEKSNPDSFVCDICGAEFASARGLASHKNKAHSE